MKLLFISKIEETDSFFVTLISLNCDLRFTFEDFAPKTDRETIFKMIKTDNVTRFNKEEYELKVQFLHHDSNATDDQEQCMFYIVANENAFDKEVVLNEGVSHTMVLDKDFPAVNYVYSFSLIIYQNLTIW